MTPGTKVTRVATITIGRLAQSILMLATIRCATTLMPPEEFGKLSLTLTNVAFFSLLLVNPVGSFINRRIHAWQINSMSCSYLMWYLGYLFCAAFFASTIILVIHWSGMINLGISVFWITSLVGTSIIFTTINQTTIPLLNALGDPIRFVWLSVATLAVSLLFAVLLSLTFSPTANHWILGLLLGQIILGMIGAKYLFTIIDKNSTWTTLPSLSRKHLLVLLNFSWPISLAALVSFFQFQGYRYLMERHLGFSQLGLFVAGYSISAGVISAIESISTTYLQPEFYRRINKQDHPNVRIQAWKEYAQSIIPPLLLTACFLILNSKELIRILLGARFYGAESFVVWGAISEMTRVLINVYTLIAHADMNTKSAIIPGSIGAGLVLLLSLILMPSLGANGVGVALSFSGFISLILLHIVLYKGKSVDRAGQNPSKHIILSLIVLVVSGYGIRILFNHEDLLSTLCMVILNGLIYLYLVYQATK